MDVHIRLTRTGDLSVQIYRQILEAVLDGRLRAGERLPPTRELARQLEVSRNTVGLAYEMLISEDVVRGRVGDGSFVCEQPLKRERVRRRAPSGAVHPRDFWRTVSLPGSMAAATRYRYDYTVGVPDAELFPFPTWRRLLAREFQSPATAAYARYGEPAGHAGLRAAIARHIGVSRAVEAEAGDVIVTQGAQQAFDLIGRVFITEGMCVAIEEPGYPYARMLFQSQGARIAGVRVDGEGIRVDEIPEDARLVYVTPSHQFPLGTAMSLQRRTALLRWAERRGALIVEDDYDSEFRFGGRPLDPVQSLDRSGCVIYVGSFSKVMLPALRIGFLVAPGSMQPALQAARRLSDWHGDLATQAALAKFIDEGLLARHIRTVAREYARRHERIAETIERSLSDCLRLIPSASGLHLAAEIVTGAGASEVVRRAEAHDVRVEPIDRFHLTMPMRNGLVLGYGVIPVSRIHEGMSRLGAAIRAS